MSRGADGLVVVVGAGGIGQPAAWALAGAGLALRVIDDDRVDASNVHRLPLVADDDVGALKTEVLRRALADERHEFVVDRVEPSTARGLLEGATLVVDACDNYATRFLLADACALLGVPSVHGAAVGWIGTVFSVVPGASACYRCVFEELPEGDALDCATAGIYGPVTSVVGGVMASDALRLIAGDRRFVGAVGSYDGWADTFRTTRFAPRRDCALCGEHATIRSIDPARYAGHATRTTHEDKSMSIQVRIPTPLRTLTQGREEVSANGHTVGELITNLETQFPGMKDRLLDEKGVRRFINVYLNEDDVRFLDALKTPVKEGDTITIVPAIAGGAR